MIVTIDEHEFHHLAVLLDSIFPECSRQMVTIVINQKGVAQGRLARVEEYALFLFMPEVQLRKHHDDLLSPQEKRNEKRFQTPRWEWLLRGGNNSRRQDREKLFYPIYVDPKTKKITGVGEYLPLSEMPDLTEAHKGTVAWPIRRNGSLGNWQLQPSTMWGLAEKGFVKLGGFDKKRRTWTVMYLNSGTRARIDRGEILVTGRDQTTGAVSVEYANPEARQRNIKTVWHRGSHDSGIYGSSVLRSVIGDGTNFPFPKSLYAVRDSLAAVVRDNPTAVILDFFAGSATTYHATALLNAEDGGQRRAILVTNNEVAEKAAKKLAREGLHPGDEGFERHGICNAVAWPRCKFATQGQRADGTILQGSYLATDTEGSELLMEEGFRENMECFRLDFMDPAQVERGDAFEGILPILWLMAGCIGAREDRRGASPYYIPKHSPFAVLLRETRFHEFREKLAERDDITHVFIVTDSAENFMMMRRELGQDYRCVQLYKSYLENFRINTADATLVSKGGQSDDEA